MPPSAALLTMVCHRTATPLLVNNPGKIVAIITIRVSHSPVKLFTGDPAYAFVSYAFLDGVAYLQKNRSWSSLARFVGKTSICGQGP